MLGAHGNQLVDDGLAGSEVPFAAAGAEVALVGPEEGRVEQAESDRRSVPMGPYRLHQLAVRLRRSFQVAKMEERVGEIVQHPDTGLVGEPVRERRMLFRIIQRQRRLQVPARRVEIPAVDRGKPDAAVGHHYHGGIAIAFGTAQHRHRGRQRDIQLAAHEGAGVLAVVHHDALRRVVHPLTQLSGSRECGDRGWR
jgi:hypothetical protein